MIPDHTPIEMADEEPSQESPHESAGHHHHGPTAERVAARDVIVAALAQRPPCPVCAAVTTCRCATPEGYSRTDAQAELIERALITYGHLPEPHVEDPFDPEEVAHWLAERSGFARYIVEDGWKRLMESDRDVELAAFKAQQRVPSGEVDMVKAGKAALLAWHQAKTV